MVSGSKNSRSIACIVRIATVLVVANTLITLRPTIRAQESAPRPAPDAQKEKETEQRQELEKKTLALLNEVASGAWGLKLPENRLFVMATAGDLLWPFDEKRARTLYWDALNSLNLITPPAARTTGENPSKAEQLKIAEAYFSVFNLRQRLLRQVAGRDAQLALDMLRATRQVPPKSFRSEFAFPDDRQLEQEIAGAIAARDPAQALQLARQSLAKGLTTEVLNLLYQLNEKDPEKASQFAGEVISKVQGANVATDFRASIIAVELLLSSRTPDGNRATLVRSNGAMAAVSLNDEQKRSLVDVLTSAALTVSGNSGLLYQISGLMPEIQHFFPERRALLERKLAAFNEALPKQQKDELALNDMIRRGVPEEILRNAAGADDATRRMLYEQAAISALAQRKADSFRDLVGKEIRDAGERKRILDFLDDQEIGMATSLKQLDELRKLLPGIQRKEERARVMAEMAMILHEKGENEEAVTLLDEAATLIKTDLKDERQTSALLTLLCAYALVDPAKAFAIAERSVDQANSQISLFMLVDRVIKTGAIRKSEFILDQGNILPLDFMLFKYGKGVAALAKTDFSRTRALSDRFERNELRLMAQLLIVKGILQNGTSSGNFIELRRM